MNRFILPIFLTLTLFLSACSAGTSASNQTAPKPASVSTESSSSGNDANTSADLLRSDAQGSVTVEVTPLDLSNLSDKLEFDVSLNTHSVDLSVDLATLATLTTDTGITVQASLWDAPRGGHHVEGKLVFPSMKDGKSILDGARKLTLTIVNLDTSSRTFEWQLK